MRIRKSLKLPTPRRYFNYIICILLIIAFLLRHTLKNTSVSLEPSTLLPQSAFPLHPSSSPLVTLILTAYNVRNFIDHSLNATLSQTYRNLQIILVDDASTDGTSQRISQLIVNDSRVQHIRLSANTFGGVATPSNVGIDAAKGKYIAFADGDDIPKPDFIQKMVHIAELSNAHFVYCNFALFEHPSKLTKAYDLKNWPSGELVKRSQIHPVHPLLFPATFQLSPVPWRKLYRTDFLIDNHIRFPEGDYFFEDNSFHWLVNIHAERISFLDDVLVLHRIGRKSQTTSPLHTESEKVLTEHKSENTFTHERTPTEQKYLKSLESTQIMKFVPNCNYVGFRVAKCDDASVEHCQLVRTAFLKWVIGSKWILPHMKAGLNEKLYKKARSVHARTVSYWVDRFKARHEKGLGQISRKPLSRVDVSIVVPVYNIENLIQEFVDLALRISVRYEVIFVDDNSTDGSLKKLMEVTERYEHMYVLHTNGMGAGRARNLGLIFCEGDYVVFLDGDDVFRPYVLDSGVWRAKMEDLEVLMMRYELEYVRMSTTGNGVSVLRTEGMFPADEKRWNRMRSGNEDERKREAGMMTNYPWTKIVKRELLTRENVYFGASHVNNDVVFHWLCVMKARKLGLFDGEALVKHRKFENRKTLTEERDETRLQLLDAVISTNRVLIENHISDNESFHECWRVFVRALVKWGRGRIGKSGMVEYERRANIVERIVNRTGDNRLLTNLEL